MDKTLRSITHHTDAGISTVHHALRAPRRRITILLIANAVTDELNNPPGDADSADITFTARELAEKIVAIEQNIPQDRATGSEYHNVYTALTQVHLDHLDDIDAIDYNADRKTITPGENLIALATVCSLTTPITRVLFERTVKNLYNRSTQ